jgi:glycolate oxidase
MGDAVHGLASLLPADRLLTRPEQLAAYESDALTAFRSRPLAVAIPETTDEVVKLVRFCHQEHLPFVARGSGTSLSGGSLPVSDGIVIALNRLTRILRLDPAQRIAVVEPGVVNTSVSLAAAPHKLHYAPDPSSALICTIGGNVAFNSGGAHCLKYGMTANHILGIKAVLPTGEVVEWGGPSREIIGPDWCGLYCGSEGLFGIALEITLQLLPKAECFHTVLAGYRTLEEAGDAVSAVVASGLLPGAIEIMDALALEAAVAAVHAEYPPGCEAVLIAELEGTREVVAADRVRLDAIIAGSAPVEARPARDAEERLAIWKGRKSAFSAVGRLSPDFIVQDGVVPRRQLGQALRRIGEMASETGLRVANVFHAGDGNLHPLILFDGRKPGALERSEALAGRILKLCIEMGGSITGEHGVGVEKLDYLPQMYSADEIDCMTRLRAAFDPLCIANPGKKFPRSKVAESVSAAGAMGRDASPRRPDSNASGRLDEASLPSTGVWPAPQSQPLTPSTPAELAEAVRTHERVLAIGARTKPRLSQVPDNFTHVSTRNLRGIVEYEPEEFTFTALAGTTVREISQVLAEKGQYLPFDPLWLEAGSTLGGTVCSGVSGPGRFRFGGVRDFILGIRFVDGLGRLLRMGGKVVKNCAGFDLPKFLVGSLGRYGILAEVTFKVFPTPGSHLTLKLPTAGAEAAARVLTEAANSRWECEALDLLPDGKTVCLRLAGPAPAIEAISREILARWPGQVLSTAEADAIWAELRELSWAHGSGVLVKVAISPAAVPSLATATGALDSTRVHFSAGGNVAYISLPSAVPASSLQEKLRTLGLPAVTLRGNGPLWCGVRSKPEIASGVKRALDPHGRFPSIED